MKNRKRCHWSRVLRKTFQERIMINENGAYKEVTILQALIKQLVNRAASGDPVAIGRLIKLLSSDSVEEEYTEPEKQMSLEDGLRKTRQLFGLEDKPNSVTRSLPNNEHQQP